MKSAIAKKAHRRLADLCQNSGETDRSARERTLAMAGGPDDPDLAFYRENSAAADDLVYTGMEHRAFFGEFHAAPGKPFGFVEGADGRKGVFVPPPLAKRLRDGQSVTGIALKSKDKHGRDSWCADTLRPTPTIQLTSQLATSH